MISLISHIGPLYGFHFNFLTLGKRFLTSIPFWFITGSGGPLVILGGGVPPSSPNPDPISDPKKFHFPHPFQTWPLGRNDVIITHIGVPTKNSSSAFKICIFLFRSYWFGIITLNTFICSLSSLANYTWFQTKVSKMYTRFQTNFYHSQI